MAPTPHNSEENDTRERGIDHPPAPATDAALTLPSDKRERRTDNPPDPAASLSGKAGSVY